MPNAIIDETLDDIDKLKSIETNPNHLLFALSSTSQDVSLVIPTVKSLAKHLSSSKTPCSTLILGWNGSNMPDEIVPAFEQAKIGYTIWENSTRFQFEKTRSKQGISNLHVEMLSQHASYVNEGKTGMLRDIAEWALNPYHFNHAYIPRTICMMDAESIFHKSPQPIFQALAEKPNKIIGAREISTAYDTSDLYPKPDPRIPVALFQEMSNKLKERVTMISGPGYFGNTIIVLSILKNLHRYLHGLVPDDVGMEIVAGCLKLDVGVDPTITVTNKVPPIWESTSSYKQQTRWEKRTDAAVHLLGCPRSYYGTLSRRESRAIRDGALSSMIWKSILYQRVDKRSLPAAAHEVIMEMRRILKRRLHPQANLDEDNKYKWKNSASWIRDQ